MGRQAIERRPRRAFRILLVGIPLLAAGCFAAPPPPPPASQCSGCTVYLTFDDGPSVYTPQILSELEAKGVPATFFVLGERAVQYPSYVQREHADGDGIGDHSWDHPDLTTLTPEQVRLELQSTADEIANLTGAPPTLWRPPFGYFNDTVTQVASSLGLSMRLWDVNPEDYTMPGTDVIVITRRAAFMLRASALPTQALLERDCAQPVRLRPFHKDRSASHDTGSPSSSPPCSNPRCSARACTSPTARARVPHRPCRPRSCVRRVE